MRILFSVNKYFIVVVVVVVKLNRVHLRTKTNDKQNFEKRAESYDNITSPCALVEAIKQKRTCEQGYRS